MYSTVEKQGKFDKVEYTKACSEVFKHFDRNQDGYLQPEEFKFIVSEACKDLNKYPLTESLF